MFSSQRPVGLVGKTAGVVARGARLKGGGLHVLSCFALEVLDGLLIFYSFDEGIVPFRQDAAQQDYVLLINYLLQLPR